MSSFTLSRLTIFADVSLTEPEDSFSPLSKAVLYPCRGSGTCKLPNSDTSPCRHCLEDEETVFETGGRSAVVFSNEIRRLRSRVSG